MPLCVDVSHWKEVPDFNLVNPRPLLFITKATEAYPGSGYNHTDEKFIRFATGMQEIGCVRGFYHFNRRLLDARKQAEHFINVISKIDILSTDVLILDIEEGGERAPQLWAWHETVRKAFPNNLRMNYSRANILNPIAMTESEREYFKKIWTWTAGYPFFPDLYSTVPGSYVPDQSKWGPAGMWQYSAHGAVTGIQGDVDLNWMSPAFIDLLGTVETGEITMASFVGKCTTTAKVWRGIGGERVYPDVWVGAPIRADGEQTVSGVKYLHLTSPIMGWSKAVWYEYRQETTPPPPPPPPTTTKTPFTLAVSGYKPFNGELEKE
jgi:GH25 family lysozyme M1 (1,4-beta-N-acetylmuramidase)